MTIPKTIMKPTHFIHLRIHSEYSLKDGIVRLKPLIANCVKDQMPAVALTDDSNLFAAVKFYKYATASGVKPILGADVWYSDEKHQRFRLTLLCQTDAGYRNLISLISKAYVEGQSIEGVQIQFEWLKEFSEGLIALSGAMSGEICHLLLNQNTKDKLNELIINLKQLFPNRFYLELQRINRPFEETYILKAMQLAAENNFPVVATNEVCFLQQEDFIAHEARVCIHDSDTLNNEKRVSRYTPNQYFRNQQEMIELFSDIPEAIINTVEIAKRCNVTLKLGKSVLPQFPVPENFTTETFLIAKAQQGLQRFLEQQSFTDEIKQNYQKRLDTELKVINEMGFAGYFLIVADFIQWAKKNNIMVGPGRGSGAGSLVAFALGITTLDPIPYDLLFERFLNPERISMPDFDIDFCMEGRDRVIDYVTQFYGRESVAQIITYGSMAAKAVVRDVGRVLGYPYGFVDTVAKLIPFELGITLDKALEDEMLQKRYQQENEVRELIDLAKKLEGITRNAGKHAGGIVIAPSKITDFAPLYCEANGEGAVTQFDKDDVEAVGLVKFDFLGLRTLTIIDWTLRTVPGIDINTIPLDDEKTYELLKACQTTAVFQLESRGMKDLIRRLQPDCFEDIIALVALFRPGPLQSGMVDDFINRKHGRAEIEYLHPSLETILRPTYGVILYQEQVMQIAQVLAGYTLGGADLLRRAMGKKKLEEMAKQRAIFLKGAMENGVDEIIANSIFDLMEKFAGYGFNKSHSAAYALISYQTAWLKAHYPAAFMAAVLSSDMDNTEKVVLFINECKHLNLTILPPDINYSQYKFSVNEKNEIIYGLGAIKGLGQNAIENIIENRNQHGAFKDLFDLASRINLRKVNRRSFEALIRAGALDKLGPNRASMLASLDSALKIAEQKEKSQLQGQQDLFGIFNLESEQKTSHQFVQSEEFDEITKLQGEKETLGFYFSGHPFEQYLDELKNFVQIRLADIHEHLNRSIRIAGLLSAIRVKKTKRGDKIAFAILDDGSAQIDISIFKECFKNYQDKLIEDTLVILDAEVGVDEFSGGYKTIVNRIITLEEFRKQHVKYLSLILTSQKMNKDFFEQLTATLIPHSPGTCPLYIFYQNDSAFAKIRLGDRWKINLSQFLLNDLKKLFGDESVKIVF